MINLPTADLRPTTTARTDDAYRALRAAFAPQEPAPVAECDCGICTKNRALAAARDQASTQRNAAPARASAPVRRPTFGQVTFEQALSGYKQALSQPVPVSEAVRSLLRGVDPFRPTNATPAPALAEKALVHLIERSSGSVLDHICKTTVGILRYQPHLSHNGATETDAELRARAVALVEALR